MEKQVRRGPIDLPEEFWSAPKKDQEVIRAINTSCRQARDRLYSTIEQVRLDVWESAIVIQCYAILVNRNDPNLQNPHVGEFLVRRLSALTRERADELSREQKDDCHITQENFLTYCMNYAQGLYRHLNPQNGSYDPRTTANIVKEIQATQVPT